MKVIEIKNALKPVDVNNKEISEIEAMIQALVQEYLDDINAEGAKTGTDG